MDGSFWELINQDTHIVLCPEQFIYFDDCMASEERKAFIKTAAFAQASHLEQERRSTREICWNGKRSVQGGEIQ